MQAHGAVLRDEHMDYTDAETLGKVTVEYLHGPKFGIQVTVSGFDFGSACSCRENNARAVAWAMDALSAALETDRLAPGGTLTIVSD